MTSSPHHRARASARDERQQELRVGRRDAHVAVVCSAAGTRLTRDDGRGDGARRDRDRGGQDVPIQRNASAGNRGRRVTALLLAGRRGAGQRGQVSQADHGLRRGARRHVDHRPSGAPAPAQPPAQQGPKRTRISAVRVASALCAVLLLLLLVFILEDSPRAWTSVTSALTGTCRRKSRSCWLPSWACCSP